MGMHKGSRCEYCDGTGDVHSIDGEWRGVCTECDAVAWAAYSRAWPEAMTGQHLHVRGWQQPRVIEYAQPRALEWEEAVLPDLLAASEHAEPRGEF